MLYPAHSMVRQRTPGNLVLKHSAPIKALLFPTFRSILGVDYYYIELTTIKSQVKSDTLHYNFFIIIEYITCISICNI